MCYCGVCVLEWRLAGGPTSISNITVVPSTEQFYEMHKHQVSLHLLLISDII